MKRRAVMSVLGAVVALGATSVAASASVIVDYTINAGGLNTEPLNGLAARATFDISGSTLTILLENTSTGVPNGFEVSDSLLTSIGFKLPSGISILSGDSALIAAGSTGLGQWGSRGPGDGVGEEWLWTNGGGGDLLESYMQVVSTIMGVQGAGHLDFNGNIAMVGGPFGGIAGAPPIIDIPFTQRAVSNGIVFTMTLSDTLSMSQLQSLASGSRVEFGSDMQYLDTPAPGAAALLGIAALGLRRRRRLA